ncbi:MAG TPA: DUF4087 domain-containing protein [Allosphingosinicella sp.]|nr:DUF4087 domain-containing protein [Allosphingosinicella sp.]
MFDTLIAIALAMLAPAQSPAGAERRCGWLSNPTPANYWLTDRDGEWTISSQGGYHAQGWDEMPDMTTRGWVGTSGSYGYGCACLNVTTDRASGRITRIYGATPVPIRQCRADRRPRRPS